MAYGGDLAAQIDHTFGYGGGALASLSTGQVLFEAGAGLCLAKLGSDSQEQLWCSPHSTLAAFAVSARTSTIAVSERSNAPGIRLIQLPGGNELAELASGSDVDTVALAFSRDGSRLVGLTGGAAPQLTVFDTARQEVLPGVEKALPNACDAASFNPRSGNELCTAGPKGIYFWKIKKTLDEFSIKSVTGRTDGTGEPTAKPGVAVNGGAGGGGGGGAALDDAELASLLGEGKAGGEQADTPANHWLAHCWGKDGSVFAANAAGEVAMFDPDSGALRHKAEMPGGSVVSALLLSREFVVAGCDDGMVRWLNPKTLAVAKEVPTSPDTNYDAAMLSSVVAMTSTTSFRTLVVGCASGALFTMELDKDEEEEEEKKKSSGLPSLSEVGRQGSRIVTVEEPRARVLGDYHTGAVLGLTVLPRMTVSDKMFATGGQDGTLRIWEYSKHRLLAKLGFAVEPQTPDGEATGEPAAITALACHAEVPLLAAGFVDGRVRLVVVVRTGVTDASATVAATHHLHSGSVLDVAFNPKHAVVATIGDDGLLAFLDVRPSIVHKGGDTAVFAFAKLPAEKGSRPQALAWRGTMELLVTLENGDVLSVVPPRATASVTPGVVDAAGIPVDAAVDITATVRVRANYGRAVGLVPDAPAAAGTALDAASTSVWVASPTDKKVRRFMPAWAPGDDVGGVALPEYERGSLDALPPVAALAGHAKGVLSVAASPCGGAVERGAVVLASGSSDGAVGVWGLSRGSAFTKHVRRLHNGAVARVAVSRDGMFVFSAGADGVVQSLMLEGSAVGEGAGSDRDVASAEGKVLHSQFVDAAEMATEEAALLDEVALANEEGGEASAAARQAAASAEAAARYNAHGAFVHRLAARNAERVSSEHEAARAAHSKDVAILGYRLKDLLTRNDKVPDLEKLDRDEFVIDVKGRDLIVAANEAKAAEVRTRLVRSNLERDVVARRIRAECWESMEVHLAAVRGFRSSAKVFNFAIRKRSAAELRHLERVKTLRRVEMMEIEDDGRGTPGTWDGLLDEFPKDCDWIINSGLFPPTVDPIEAAKTLEARRGDASAEGTGGEAKGGDDQASDEEYGEGAGGDDEDGGAGEETMEESARLISLIYHPMAARSPNQKRTQILLLQELVRMVRLRFNKAFDDLRHAKEDEMDKINGRNARIREIMADMGEETEFFQPSLADDEVPERVLAVEQDEIGFERYITEAERKRLEEEERRRAEAAGKHKDDAPERALMDMMNGTLEAKDELSKLESDLVREPWMDELSEAEMTEEQRKQLAEFEATQKAVMEEKAKQRKALEAELKKLKSEVKEIVSNFDARVAKLSNDYLAVLQYCNAQELHMSRLAMAVQEREDGALREERLLEKLDQLCDVRDDIADKHDAFQERYDAFVEAHENIERNDKAMDKNFRTSLQQVSGTLDGETMKIMVGLFKQRAHGQRSSSFGGGSSTHGGRSTRPHPSFVSRRRSQPGADSTRTGSKAGGDSMKSAMKSALDDVDAQKRTLDPFADEDVSGPTEEEQEAKEREEALAPLSLEADCPEGFEVDEATWAHLQDLRTQKIESELELRKSRRNLSDLEAALTELGDQLDLAEDKIAEVQNRRELLLEQRAVAGSNLELLVRLQQGQDEMESEGVVTDYSDAILINRRVVEEANSSIRALGSEVVDTLESIKEFRKNINHMLWEHRFLEATAIDTEEHYTDLHMLRVTKTLQEFLKGGDLAERRRRDIEKADAKLEHVRASHTRSQQKLRKQLQKGRRQLRARAEENERLQAQLKELNASVSVRASIQESRSAGRGGAADPKARASQRMKAITTRRKLIDLARAQTDEIEFLRQELDRLRQRTFPSFAHASRMAGGVDEY